MVTGWSVYLGDFFVCLIKQDLRDSDIQQQISIDHEYLVDILDPDQLNYIVSPCGSAIISIAGDIRRC